MVKFLLRQGLRLEDGVSGMPSLGCRIVSQGM